MAPRRDLKLVVEKGPLAGSEMTLPTDRSILIGRRKDADVFLTGDDFVSIEHAEIIPTPAGALLRNRSANGTLLNGHPVTEAALSAGDRIAVGLMHLLTVKAIPVSAPTPAAAAAAGPAAAPMSSTDRRATPAASGGRTVKPRARLKLPAWLIAYLVLMGIVGVFLGYTKLKASRSAGLRDVQAQEQQYAAARGWHVEETARVLRLLETAVVHERRGDVRSAYEAYREALGVRRPIDPRAPAYRYAAGRMAALELPRR